MKEKQTIVRKIQIYPIGDKEEIDRVYKFIRDGQYAQYCALNTLMGQLVSTFYAYGKDLKNEEFIVARKNILANTNPLLSDFEFAVGVDTKSAVTQKVKQDFMAALKNGLASGERSITNYKRTFPLITRGRDIRFTHGYSDHIELIEHLSMEDCDIVICWVNKIKFKVILGNLNKSQELRAVIRNIFEENYRIQQSSIQFDKTNKKIILNLSMEIPNHKCDLDPEIVVGVDMGVAVPAMCSLNTNDYVKMSIGSKEDFLKVRTQLQAQRKRLQKALAVTAGGHGRKKKLKALDNLRARERNFVKTYNHHISKKVVDFALKNKAKYINIEDLSGYDSNQFVLRNWSFYELQQYITYKAEKYGIEIRKINPYHTSQNCSCCGNWEEGQRVDQAHFECKKCGIKLNADFNASRNIAKSMDFV